MLRRMVLMVLGLIFFSHAIYSQLELAWSYDLPGLSKMISTVKFSNDSRMLLCQVAHLDTMYLFDVESGEIISTKIKNVSLPYFSNDDKHIYGIQGNHIAKYNVQTAMDESNFEDTDSLLTISILSKDENYLFASNDYGFTKWDAKTGKILKHKVIYRDTTIRDASHNYIKLNRQHQLDIKVNCDNTEIYVRTYTEYVETDPYHNKTYFGSSIIRVYDFNTLDSIGVLDKGDWTLILSSDCSMMLYDTQDENGIKLKTYNTQSKELISTIDLGDNTPSGIKFTSDNKYLVTAVSGYNPLAIWDIKTGNQINKKYNYGTFKTLDVSNSIKYIATSFGNILYLLKFSTTDIQTNEPIEEIIYPNPTTGNLNIEINLPISSILTCSISAITGKYLGEIYRKAEVEGKNNIQLNLGNYPNGTYFVTLNAVNYNQQFKVIIDR